MSKRFDFPFLLSFLFFFSLLRQIQETQSFMRLAPFTGLQEFGCQPETQGKSVRITMHLVPCSALSSQIPALPVGVFLIRSSQRIVKGVSVQSTELLLNSLHSFSFIANPSEHYRPESLPDFKRAAPRETQWTEKQHILVSNSLAWLGFPSWEFSSKVSKTLKRKRTSCIFSNIFHPHPAFL